MSQNGHPSRDELELYVIGAHDELDVTHLEQHMSTCERCAVEVREQARLEGWMQSVGAEATFCIGCDRLVLGARCGNCGCALTAGCFRIERVLVQNAHGRVYLATDDLGRRVALKELVFTQIPSVAVLEGFEREARVLRQLRHPAIPRFISSFSEGEGVNLRLYLAQEHVEGTSLLDRVRSHRFSEAEATEIARRVLEILVYLQSLSPQVFHRDLKPANLIQRTDGSIALVDFGSARELGATTNGTVAGTAGYIPLEQLVGVVDPSSDLYALGTTLRHLLTQEAPWQLLEDELKPARWNITPAFGRFLAKLSAQRPQARYRSAREALDALVLAGRSNRSRWKPVLAAAVLAAAAGTAGYAKFRPHGRSSERDRPIGYSSMFEEKPTQPSVRSMAATAQLSDGSVVLAGGLTGYAEAQWTLEVYHPATRTWTWSGYLHHPRVNHTATTFAEDLVLITGGRESVGSPPVAFSEIFNPKTNGVRRAAPLNHARDEHAAVRLRDGRVLVVGGRAPPEVWDPKDDEWSDIAEPEETPGETPWLTSTLLTDGRVLIVGDRLRAQIYDPDDDRWTLTAPCKIARRGHTASLLPDGKVMIAGGLIVQREGEVWRELGKGDLSTAAWLYDPSTDRWEEGPKLPRGRAYHAAIAMPDEGGRILLVGGTGHPQVLDKLDPSTRRWFESVEPIPSAGRARQDMAWVRAGGLLLVGGTTDPGLDHAAHVEVLIPPGIAQGWREVP